MAVSQSILEKFPLSTKLQKTEKSVWMELHDLSKSANAIQLDMGFVDDFPPPSALTALNTMAADSNYLIHHYTRGWGHPRLVNVIASLYSRLLDVPVDAQDDVLVTLGAHQALFGSALGLLDAADEAVIMEPFFDCYAPQVHMTGGLNQESAKPFALLQSQWSSDWTEKFALSDKLVPTLTSDLFGLMTLAREVDAYNLGMGFPDYLPPSVSLDALVLAAQNARVNPSISQYTRGWGHPRLVTALARLYSRCLDVDVDPMNHVLITVGAGNALFNTCFALINPGDEVIVIEPFFRLYWPLVHLNTATPKFVPLRLRPKDPEASQFSSADMVLDMEELEAAFSQKTKLLFLNNPNNPCGKVFSRSELMKIAELVKRYNVVVLADEVYEWMTYDGQEMVRFASLPDMYERTVTIGSAGKTFSSTGWKLGWAIAPPHLMNSIRVSLQNCTYAINTPLQEACAIAFEKELERFDEPDCYFKSIVDELRPKRDYMASALRDAGLRPIVPEGGYFMLAEYTKLVTPDINFEKYRKANEPLDYAFVRWMTTERKLATIPPTAFYDQSHKALGEKWIRICFFKKDETLRAAAGILKALARK